MHLDLCEFAGILADKIIANKKAASTDTAFTNSGKNYYFFVNASYAAASRRAFACDGSVILILINQPFS